MTRMDVHHEYNDIEFVWDAYKAARNFSKHGVRFEEAIAVFSDPFFILTDASRQDQERAAVIGLDASARLLFVVHIELDTCIRVISARRATTHEEHLYAEGNP